MLTRTEAAARLEDFIQDRDGVSAVEFAIVLPFLLSLYLGCISLSQAISVDRKVMTLAQAVGDVVTKSGEVSSSELASLAALAPTVLAPAPAKGSVVTVVAVWTDAQLKTTVEWSHRAAGDGGAVKGTPPAKGASYALAEGLARASSQTIVTIVDYPYTPRFGAGVVGTIDLNETVHLKPRSGKCVSRSDGGAGSCGSHHGS